VIERGRGIVDRIDGMIRRQWKASLDRIDGIIRRQWKGNHLVKSGWWWMAWRGYAGNWEWGLGQN
jgi:hypothetical protein